MSYSANDDYCNQAKQWQAVPTEDDARADLISKGQDSSDASVRALREKTKYSCNDSYQMGTIQDDHIFVSTTDEQHEQIINGELADANDGLSGFFTDQATVDNCTNSGILDNRQLNREMQVAPFQADASQNPSYKPHLDCFKINSDKLESNYGTKDFNAAVAKCDANNQYGEGGGNQGYNTNLEEMIHNGSLEYDKTNSFSDSSLSNVPSDMQNPKSMNKSAVSQDDYDGMMQDARDRSSDCVKNNTEHPSKEVVNNTGYAHNANPVESNTGHATSLNNQKNNQSEMEERTKQGQQQAKGSEGHESGSSSGMPTTADNTKHTDSDLGKQNSSDGMPTTAAGFNQNKSQGQDLSGGMSTTAEGQDGSTYSSSAGQSHNAGQNM